MEIFNDQYVKVEYSKQWLAYVLSNSKDSITIPYDTMNEVITEFLEFQRTASKEDLGR